MQALRIKALSMFDEFKINVIIEMIMIMMTSMMIGVHWVCESFAFGFEIVVAGAFEIVHSEIVAAHST